MPLAGFLWSALHLHEALGVCDEILIAYPDKALPAMKLKAQVLASQRRLAEALDLARQINSNPAAGFFRAD
jgi:hypothetical protein